MTNNDIFKKLRVALQLRDDQIVEILELVDFRISKGEIGNFFRNEDHPKYMECQDQILRNFLNGLVIYLRGTKENPKNPREVLAHVESTKKPAEKQQVKDLKSSIKPKNSAVKSDMKKTGRPAAKVNKSSNSTTPTKKEIIGNFKYNSGKTKK